MWGKEKGKKVDFDRHAGKTTMVAKGTQITGDIRFEGGLIVEGVVKGNVIAEAGSESLIRLSEAGRVEGDISVPNVVINGTVNGDVHSSEHIALASKAVINGTVHYNLIEMVMGASVNGSLVHANLATPPEVEAKGAKDKAGKESKVDYKANAISSELTEPALDTKQSPA